MWFILGGFIMGLFSFLWLFYTIYFLHSAEKVVGEVVGQVGGGSGDMASYWPIVRFYDKANVEHIVKSKNDSGSPYIIGSEITVRYNPDNPKRILVNWQWMALLMVLVFVLSLLSILYGINEVCSFHAVLQKVFGSN